MKVKLLKKVRKNYSIVKVKLDVRKMDIMTKIAKYGLENVSNYVTIYRLLYKNEIVFEEKDYKIAVTRLLNLLRKEHGKNRVISSEKVWYK